MVIKMPVIKIIGKQGRYKEVIAEVNDYSDAWESVNLWRLRLGPGWLVYALETGKVCVPCVQPARYTNGG